MRSKTINDILKSRNLKLAIRIDLICFLYLFIKLLHKEKKTLEDMKTDEYYSIAN